MSTKIEEIVAAQEAGAIANETEARAVSVNYDAGADRVVLELRSGFGMHIPRAVLQGLSEAKAEDLNNVEVLGGGQAVYWPTLDAGFTVPGLANHIFGTRSWMAKLGGSAKSEVKTLSSRKNGAKGGRPKSSSRSCAATV